MQQECKKCGAAVHVTPKQRDQIRWFLSVYPWVQQKDIGTLFSISQARVSEIVRKDAKKGGE